MNKRSRGFTLVEVLICLGLLGVLVYPVYSMVETTVKAYGDSIRQVDLRSELARTEAQLKRLARANSNYKIDQDNRGLRWSDGSNLLWENKQLTHKGRNLVGNVDSFSLFKRDGATFVTLRLVDARTERAEQTQFVLEEVDYASSRL
jgi:prepilin-type N-terminal cleavage/methylation domain-containing protein